MHSSGLCAFQHLTIEAGAQEEDAGANIAMNAQRGFYAVDPAAQIDIHHDKVRHMEQSHPMPAFAIEGMADDIDLQARDRGMNIQRDQSIVFYNEYLR